MAILALSLSRGVGGLRGLDVTCYGLLLLDVIFWLTTKNTLLALHLTVLADLIAMFPTLAKTWHDPKSETPLFFIIGSIGPLVGVVAAGQLNYAIILFPLYLALINTLEVALIYRTKIFRQGGGILTG